MLTLFWYLLALAYIAARTAGRGHDAWLNWDQKNSVCNWILSPIWSNFATKLEKFEMPHSYPKKTRALFQAFTPISLAPPCTPCTPCTPSWISHLPTSPNGLLSTNACATAVCCHWTPTQAPKKPSSSRPRSPDTQRLSYHIEPIWQHRCKPNIGLLEPWWRIILRSWRRALRTTNKGGWCIVHTWVKSESHLTYVPAVQTAINYDNLTITIIARKNQGRPLGNEGMNPYHNHVTWLHSHILYQGPDRKSLATPSTSSKWTTSEDIGFNGQRSWNANPLATPAGTTISPCTLWNGHFCCWGGPLQPMTMIKLWKPGCVEEDIADLYQLWLVDEFWMEKICSDCSVKFRETLSKWISSEQWWTKRCEIHHFQTSKPLPTAEEEHDKSGTSWCHWQLDPTWNHNNQWSSWNSHKQLHVCQRMA